MRSAPLLAGTFAVALLVASSLVLAQGVPGASAPGPAQAAVGGRIEQRIKSLHDQLKITAAQESQWSAVADAMRDNARTVGALIRERRENAASMNAVDDLRAYQAIAEAHASGIAKLASAFDVLYAVMPPEQQKNADAVFARSMHRPAARRKAG
ncbi:MAG: Spy/CpxP family protein refolding chaperone [Burkholderiales bacterium]